MYQRPEHLKGLWTQFDRDTLPQKPTVGDVQHEGPELELFSCDRHPADSIFTGSGERINTAIAPTPGPGSNVLLDTAPCRLFGTEIPKMAV